MQVHNHIERSRYVIGFAVFWVLVSITGCNGSGTDSTSAPEEAPIESGTDSANSSEVVPIGSANQDDDLLFLASAVPEFLANKMAVTFSEYNESFPSTKSYSVFDDYRQAAFSKYGGLVETSEINDLNAGYLQTLALAGPFDDSVGHIDSEQPLSWRQLSVLLGNLVVRTSDPLNNGPFTNLCRTGYYTAVKGQISVDGSRADGVAVEFVGCKLTFFSATISGRLSGFHRIVKDGDFNHELKLVAAADDLEIRTDVQSLSITGVEFWESSSECLEDLRGISNLHIANIEDNREILIVDRSTGSDNSARNRICNFTIDLANEVAGVIYDSSHGNIAFKTTEKLFEHSETSEQTGISISRRRFDDVILNLDAELELLGKDNSSANLTFVSTGDTERDIVVVQLETTDSQAVTSTRRTPIEAFAYSTWISDLDSDSDEMPDTWEILYGLDPMDASDATSDPDFDSLTSLQEFNFFGSPISAINGILYDRQATFRTGFRYFGSVEPTAPLGVTGFSLVGSRQSKPTRGEDFKLTLEIIGPALMHTRRVPLNCVVNEALTTMECDMSGAALSQDMEFLFRPYDYGEIIFQATVEVPDYDFDAGNNVVRKKINYDGQGQ